MELKDKVVVITGASKGLGAELAKTFAKEEAKPVISARNEEELKKVAMSTGGAWMPCDVSQEEEVDKLAKFVLTKFGRIDVWINNAGVRLPHATIEETNMKRIREIFDINVFGTMHGCRVALKQMKKQKSGVVVNILSTAALEGKPKRAAYAASKFALVGFTQAIRAEATSFGIKVIAVYSGGMQTHFFDEEKPLDYSEYMNPSEVARKIVDNLKQENPQEEQVIKRKV